MTIVSTRGILRHSSIASSEMLLFATPRTSVSEISDNVNNKCSDEADQVGAPSAKLNVERSAAMTIAATGGGCRGGEGSRGRG